MNIKKILGAVLIVVLGVAVIVAVWWFQPSKPMEEILPQGAVAYMRLSRGADLAEEFMNSDFFKKLKAIDVPKILEHNKADAQRMKQFEDFKRQWIGFNENPWLKRLLGKEITVALYVDREKGFYPILLLRLDHTLQAMHTISQLFQLSNEKVALKKIDVRGQTVFMVSMKKHEQPLFYVRWDDVLVVAMDQVSHLDGVINRRLGKALALKQDPLWQFTKKQSYPHADMDAYIAPHALISALMKEPKLEEISPIERLKDFKVFSLSFNQKEASRFRFSVDVDQARVSRQEPFLVECPNSAQNKSMDFVPVNMIAYNWGNCYDIASYWKSIKKQLEAYPMFAQSSAHYMRVIKNRFGIDIETDVIPLIGNEVGGYLTDIDTKALFPYPRFLSFVKITDKDKMVALLSTLKAKFPVEISQEEYQGTTIHYLTLPVGSNTDPGYCVLGDYLLFSSSRQLLKKSIETFAAPATALAGDKVVKELGLMETPVSNAMMLLRTDAVVKRIKSLAGWADKYLTAQVATAVTYQKEWDTRQGDFDSLVEEKNQELSIAQDRLKQLQEDLEGLNTQEQQKVIVEDMKRLHEDIDSVKRRKEEGFNLVKAYQKQAQSAKAIMFNTEHLLMPILDAFETISAQSIKTRIKATMIQSEIVIK